MLEQWIAHRHKLEKITSPTDSVRTLRRLNEKQIEL